MKNIALLGSTGSVGTSTLQVARHLKGEVKVVALAAKGNTDLLERQVREFSPGCVAVFDQEKARELQKRVPHTPVLVGMEGLEAVACYREADLVVSAIAGTAGLRPTIAAIQAGKHIALANKEVLVSAGALVTSLAREKGVELIPVDSEHSAIFQCLKGSAKGEIRRLILTSSGGPFREWKQEQLQSVTVEKALSHPTWKMGPKVTIDSSTLMNKGLEVIEAYWLFGVPVTDIQVVIHPQSVIHSLLEFIDGSILAQMSEPSMTIPIQYALTHPRRLEGEMKPFDFMKHSTLQFFEPDAHKFRCLGLAYEALRQGGSLPGYMNAANEVLVGRFLNRQLSWDGIAIQLERLMERHCRREVSNLQEILAIDEEARREASNV